MFILRLIFASLIFAVISVVWATSDSDVNDQNDEENDDDEYAHGNDKRGGKRYDEYTGKSLMRFHPQKPAHLTILKNMQKSNKFIELFFWDSPDALNKHVDVVVPYQQVKQLYKLSKEHGLYIQMVHRYIKQVLKNEESRINAKDLKPELFNLNNFNTHNSTNTWLDYVARRCAPDCETIDLGKSYEGRILKLIKIGTAPKGIFIDAGFHAREWGAITSAIHLIEKLTNKNDALGQYLLSKFTFHIIPMANPDGYEYSRIREREWRKTRTTEYSRKCPGVDPNRNFDIEFGGEGSSSDMCVESYQGPSAFSEPESTAVAIYIYAQKSSLAGYMATHTYGKMIMYPWACNKSLVYDSKDLDRVAVRMNSEIKKNTQVNYVYGPISTVIYVASGSSSDWVKAEPRVKFSYAVELGESFVVPPEQIEPLAQQFIYGIKGMVDGMVEYYYKG